MYGLICVQNYTATCDPLTEPGSCASTDGELKATLLFQMGQYEGPPVHCANPATGAVADPDPVSGLCDARAGLINVGGSDLKMKTRWFNGGFPGPILRVRYAPALWRIGT